MHVKRVDEVPGTPMDIPGAEKVTMRLLFGREHGAPTFAMRHFTIEPGGHSPKHQHNYEHGIYVVAGRGALEIDGETKSISAGDSTFVKPNALHQFRADQGEPLQFLCMAPTTFDCGQPTPGT